MIKLNRAVAGILRVVPVIAVVLFFVFNRSYPLWFEFLNSGLGTVGSALVFIVTISAVCFAATYNDGEEKRLADVAAGTGLIVEFLCLPLFLRRHPLILALIFAIEAVIAAALVFLIVRANSGRMKAREALARSRRRVSRVLVRILCLLLVIPAATGVYEQYFRYCSQSASFGTSVTGDGASESERFAALNSWRDLGTQAKEELIKRIAENEREYLGISSDIRVIFNDQKDTLAFYNDAGKLVAYDRGLLAEGSLKRCVNAILHEMHHAYVHDVVAAVDWTSPEANRSGYYRDARRWRESIENYVSSRVDYDAYYNTAIEVDARAYANERTEYYLELAGNYAAEGDG